MAGNGIEFKLNISHFSCGKLFCAKGNKGTRIEFPLSSQAVKNNIIKKGFYCFPYNIRKEIFLNCLTRAFLLRFSREKQSQANFNFIATYSIL